MKITIEVPDELVDSFRIECQINLLGVVVNGDDLAPIYKEIMKQLEEAKP